MIWNSHLIMQNIKSAYSQQLQLCREYFNAGQFEQLNDIFLPLLDKEVPEALLTKVDFLMQKDANQGIGYLLKLAENNVPMANYKMAMLLYFHPELTLDFNTYLKQAYLQQETQAVIACAYLAYANNDSALAEQILLSHAEHDAIKPLIAALNLKVQSDKPKPSYKKFKRPNNTQMSLKCLNKEISLATKEHFLNEFECVWLKLRAKSSLEPSMVVNAETGEKIQSPVRSNQFSQLIPTLNDWVLLDIEQRIANLIKLPISHGEVSNMLYYQKGNEYKAHYDFFHPKDPGSALAMQDGGQRVRTVLCYLSAADSGGETYFPRISEKISGQVGQLIVFDNVSRQLAPLPLSLHQSLPVTSGEKWLLSKWYRLNETSYKKNLSELNL
jgi:prolyl 4-hydroxylase